MTEVLFYHLERRGLEDVLPGLLEKTRERGWRALVRVGSAERMAALDAHLWSYDDQAFLAHGTAADGLAKYQPVFLTVEEENPNAAEVLFLVGGAAPADWTDDAIAALIRVVLLFDGRDEEALAAARGQWKLAKDAGHAATYWKQSESGRWEKQA